MLNDVLSLMLWVAVVWIPEAVWVVTKFMGVSVNNPSFLEPLNLNSPRTSHQKDIANVSSLLKLNFSLWGNFNSEVVPLNSIVGN